MQIHFTGSVRYGRPDGLHPGADNIVIKIWDEDAISDELIWSGVTDNQGNFDVNVTWDDCDISGCDDPDIYLEIIAANGNVDVQEDDILETPHHAQAQPGRAVGPRLDPDRASEPLRIPVMRHLPPL